MDLSKPRQYFGACDGSAAIALDDKHILVGVDDDNMLKNPWNESPWILVALTQPIQPISPVVRLAL